jgi:hypothetical protein
MTPINPQTGHFFENSQDILTPTLIDIINQRIAESGYDDEFMKVGYVTEEVFTKDGTITSMIGPEALKEIVEGATAPIINKEQGFEKGFRIKQFARKMIVSKLLSKWIMKNETLASADPSVQTEIRKLMEDVTFLADGAKLTLNNEGIGLLAKGFSVTQAFGGGSAAPDGEALFSNAHIIKKTWGTYDNLASGVINEANLRAAIDLHKTDIRMGNGRRVRTADVYTLLVPRALETLARTVLTPVGFGSGAFSTTDMSIFDFEGNKLRLIVSDVLGQPDDNGGTIGTDLQWFVINDTLARQIKAFRVFELYGQEVTTWFDDDTGNFYVKLDMAFGVDHYQPEVIVGSTGV